MAQGYLCLASGQWRAREQDRNMTDAFVIEKACDQPLHSIALGDSETLDEKLEVLHYLVYKTEREEV